MESGEMPVAVKSIFVMKKNYINVLVDSQNNIGFHCRMKGIPTDVIVLKANELYPTLTKCYLKDRLVRPCDNILGQVLTPLVNSFYSQFSVVQLYQDLYDGKEIIFDLTKSSKPSFEFKKNYTIENRQSFIRKIKLN
jgi:hypothetical protein